MTKELEDIYELEVEVADLNEDSLLKPYAYQNLIAKVAEKHLTRHEVNVQTTMKYNLTWALVSISYEIQKPITSCGKLFANTWYSQRKGPYFRREVLFKDEKGDVVFKGSTFSVILDMEKRSVHRKKEVPFLLFEPINRFTIDAKPTFKSRMEYEAVETRTVQSSQIDLLGHVNNSRYGEFAYDVFTEAERKELTEYQRMEYYFQSELRRGETFSLHKAKAENQLIIRGYNETRACVSFEVVFSKAAKLQKAEI